jgi:hypothetical protein
MGRSIKVKLKIYLTHLLFIGNGFYLESRYFYQTEQVDVNKIVGKEIDPKLPSRLGNTYVIYE